MTPTVKPASDFFWNNIETRGGSTHIECRCGKEWTNTVPEGLTREEEIDDWYWHEARSYAYAELDGKIFVEDCETCGEQLGRYEAWVWQNRNTIRDYLRQRVDHELKIAEQERLLNTIAGFDRHR